MTLLRNVSSPGAPTSGAAVAARAIGATKTYGEGDGAVRALDRVDVEFTARASSPVATAGGGGSGPGRTAGDHLRRRAPGNLDSRSGAENLCAGRLRELGQTIVMVTHDPGAASADRVVFLADGRIVD